MIEINLVPDVKQELIRAQRMRVQVVTYSIIVGIVAVGIVVALSIYVFGVQFGLGKWQDGQIDSKYSTLSGTKDLSQILTIQNQLQQIPTLHNQSPVTSRLFDVLSSIDPPAGDPNNVTISQLSVNTTAGADTIDLQAQTSGYPSLETFQKTLKNAQIVYTDSSGTEQKKPIASNLNLINVSYGQGDQDKLVLSFELQFTYEPTIFDATVTNPHIEITDLGNATDSYINLPKTLWQASSTTSGGSN